MFYILTGKLKLFLFILFFPVLLLPNSYLFTFEMTYITCLTFTLLLSDSDVKWDRLARTMPCSAFQVVFSKYFLVYILQFLTAVLAFFSSQILGSLLENVVTPAVFCRAFLLPGGLIGLLFLAVCMPFEIRFDIRKSQWVVTVLCIVCALLFTFPTQTRCLKAFFLQVSPLAWILLGITAVLLNVVSIFLSVRFYSNKEY
ncbi:MULTISPECIES: ABC-2 transporter permease [Caproicibacterium]|uniref:ABC-2 transporter permease n=1 Tax=Caproicibacterium argilliputei TaxID=3030016 RepID=A0AA97DAH4_9FIRM|nr:ABC-2 transporter permease [Caproicibacterium argilliputei]WOC33620.1 ABC-2 transporter permease [Caproicibacterium argilliputei]